MRYYMIINVSDLEFIDISEILEDSVETIRKSLDNTKAIIKWEGEIIPNTINNLTIKDGPYTNQEIFLVIQNIEWIKPDDEPQNI